MARKPSYLNSKSQSGSSNGSLCQVGAIGCTRGRVITGTKAINPFRQLCAIGGTTPMKNDSDGRAKVPSEPHRIGRLVIFAEFERALIAEHAGQDSPPRAPALVAVVVRDRPPGEVST